MVDAEPQVAEVMQAELEDDGHAADAVSSGQAVAGPARPEVYDRVVCDVRMPDASPCSRRSRSYPASNLFMSGYRVRLDVSSSNFPRLDAS